MSVLWIISIVDKQTAFHIIVEFNEQLPFICSIILTIAATQPFQNFILTPSFTLSFAKTDTTAEPSYTLL